MGFLFSLVAKGVTPVSHLFNALPHSIDASAVSGNRLCRVRICVYADGTVMRQVPPFLEMPLTKTPCPRSGGMPYHNIPLQASCACRSYANFRSFQSRSSQSDSVLLFFIAFSVWPLSLRPMALTLSVGKPPRFQFTPLCLRALHPLRVVLRVVLQNRRLAFWKSAGAYNRAAP